MKVTLAKPQVYHIETLVNIPKETLESYGAEEIAFSPNPYDPVIVYEIPIESEKAKEFMDRILATECK